jgi:phosphopantetheine adenylyltransferase
MIDNLTGELIRPFLDEGSTKIKKVVAIYPGRFQPFGPHHKAVYDKLNKMFDDVYISTSNIQKPPRHPLNFKEKAVHISKMGIPKNKIVEERSPYAAINILKNFNLALAWGFD